MIQFHRFATKTACDKQSENRDMMEKVNENINICSSYQFALQYIKKKNLGQTDTFHEMLQIISATITKKER